MKFAILAPGYIAQKMARAVSGIDKIERCAVASRDMARAKAFAEEWGFEKAYGSYQELVEDPEVELVYVASPNVFHYEHARLCLEHGKHVLLEKPFTVNAAQAESLVRLAEERGLLLAEAMWTRYLPSRDTIRDLVEDEVVGKVTSVTANLGYVRSHIHRLNSAELGGGALLDLGVYALNFALMVFPEKIKHMSSSAVISETGVDFMNGMTLAFEGGKIATLQSSLVAQTDRLGVISGDQGHIEVQNINHCKEIRVFNRRRQMMACYKTDEQVNGYEYEVQACIRAIEDGRSECEEMPHSETLRVMKIMDQARRDWGLVFPCEE